MLLFTNDYVRLVVTSNTVDESNTVMDAVRIRILPCQQQQLYRCMKELLTDEKLSDKALKAVILCARRTPDQLKTVSLKPHARLLKRWKKEFLSQMT